MVCPNALYVRLRLLRSLSKASMRTIKPTPNGRPFIMRKSGSCDYFRFAGDSSRIECIACLPDGRRIAYCYCANTPGTGPLSSVKVEPTVPTTADLRVSPARCRSR
jgi:hypothetical protein